MSPPRRILVVEDDTSVRGFLADVLQQEGYEVLAVENGHLALELLSCWCPDLIVLDLHMPVLDGWAFRDAQLARQDCATVPVMVMTAGLTTRCLIDRLEAAAVFPKPFDLDQLLATVESLADGGARVS